MKRKVVAYIRVSTEEQAREGYSIPAQRQILRDYAQGHELSIVGIFEEAESAFRPGRPKYGEMLRFLREHREVTGVLCYKIDRIARNLQDYSALDEMPGVSIISATEALPENSTGKLIGTVQAAFSRYYSEQLGERVSLGMLTKAKKGLWPTRAPIGYLNDGTTKQMIRDPERANLVQELFEMYAHRDVPLSELVSWAQARGLRARGGSRLAKSEIHKLLTNPVYHGKVVWKGALYDGCHEPLVSKELFDRVRERLDSKSAVLTKRSFAYRGLLECGYCGCNITTSLEKGKYVYYHCTHGRGKCRQPYVPEEQLGELLKTVIDRVHLSKVQISELFEAMKRDKQQRELDRARKLRELKAKGQVVSARRDSAYMDKLDGKITEDRWLEIEQQLALLRDAIREDVRELESGHEPLVDDVRAAFELLERAPRLYQKQSHDERARLLRAVLSNCVIRGETLDPIYKKPFDLVAIGVETNEWWACLDSNQGPPAYQASALTS